MGISMRAYAKIRGVSEAAVRKAVSSGRITPNDDGTIDAERANREWEENTGFSRAPNDQDPSGADGGSESTMAFKRARATHETAKALMARLALDEKRGDLIDKHEVGQHIGLIGRRVRDSWMNWPSRVAPLMAVELGVDERILHITLEKYVREHLDEIPEHKLKEH